MRMQHTIQQLLPHALPPRFDHLPKLKRGLLSALAKVHEGRLLIYLDGKHYVCGDQELDVDHPLQAMIRLHQPARMARRCLLRGDIGFAESYIAGEWTTDDLGALLKLLLHNRDTIGKRMYGQKLLRMGTRLFHALRRNSRAGSRRNISQHYDLGNDFYTEWLDPGMTYSAALFDQSDDLEQAQTRKYQRILDEIGARPGQTVLEIGCGWGGFAEQALEQGLQVYGVTLSTEQLDYARQRVGYYGKQVQLALRDYRDIEGQYDHIVSIEMMEAVGERYWPTYFKQIERLLKPGGKAVIQVITIGESYYEPYRSRPDFIQRYIFPGGMLPTATHLQQLVDNNGLRCINKLSFGQDYARTLSYWEQSFVSALHKLNKLGYDERFERMWRYYLAYCEAGFTARRIDVVQWTLCKNTNSK